LYKKTPKKIYVNLDENSRDSSANSLKSSDKKLMKSLGRSNSQPVIEMPNRRSRKERIVQFSSPASYATFIQNQNSKEEMKEQIAL